MFGEVEPLIAASTEHLSAESLRWLLSGGAGAIVYPNEHGGFLFCGYPNSPDFLCCVPPDVRLIARKAWGEGVAWIKFDAGAAFSDELAVYLRTMGDGDRDGA